MQWCVGAAGRRRSTCLFSTGGFECRCAQFKVLVVMVSRYPSAILRHGLDFGGRDTPATTILKPTRAPGNNSGLGPPSVARPSAPTATQLVDVPTVASRGEAVAMEAVEQGCRSHLSRGRPLKGFTSRELRHRLAKQGGEKQCGQVFKPDARPMVTTVQGEWEFPPARPAAPGRKKLSPRFCRKNQKSVFQLKGDFCSKS